MQPWCLSLQKTCPWTEYSDDDPHMNFFTFATKMNKESWQCTEIRTPRRSAWRVVNTLFNIVCTYLPGFSLRPQPSEDRLRSYFHNFLKDFD